MNGESFSKPVDGDRWLFSVSPLLLSLSLFSFSPITHVVHVTSSNFLEVKLNKCAWKETRNCIFAEESSLYNYCRLFSCTSIQLNHKHEKQIRALYCTGKKNLLLGE